MRLKKLILHGFKSFADRTEVSFDGGITGVVGPNGCGKSNISDAVRWVLGEQSAKTLRGGKMEDVIFNGTEKRRRLAFCEVSLVFENEDRKLPIDFAEVCVTRRVYRSGEGEYKINDANCRLKDIVELFRDTGIGRDGYSLIGQGRIDEILSQKSEDRRQVFEEAAGIVKYKARKIEAQRRMERTQENIDRIDDIISELEKRMGPLKEQSIAAREYLALRDELKGLELNVFLVRTERYEARLAELKEVLEGLSKSMEDLDAELTRTEEKRTLTTDELQVFETQTAEKREEVQAFIREVEAGEGALGVLRERIAALEREKNRLLAEQDAALSGKDGVKKRVEELSVFIEGESAALEEARCAQDEMEKLLGEAESELTELQARAEAEKQEIITRMQRYSDVQSRRARLSAMKTSLEQQIESREGDLQREREGVESLGEHVRQAQDVYDEVKRRRDELKTEITDSEDEVKRAALQAELLTKEAGDVRSAHQQALSRLKLLKEMERDYEGFNNAVKQVLLQARRMNKTGVHGVVANLLSVPEKLERAMDMVLGAALQNVVVDRDEDAKEMIDYLRRNRMGRATFLPIRSIRGRTLSDRERDVLKMPGCVGLASELVQYDEVYRPVMESLLGRTVVAEDLNSGIAIQRAGHYQFRLVTLEGDVMHSGGSMTGGSVQSRATSLLSRTREIEQTEKSVKNCEEKLAHLQEKLTELEGKRSETKQQRTQMYEELRMQEAAVARAEAQLQAAFDEQKSNNTRVERADKEHARLLEQLHEIEGQLADMQGADEEARRDTADRREAVKRMQEEIYQKNTAAEALRDKVNDGRVALASRTRGLEARTQERDRFVSDAQNTEVLLKERGEKLTHCEEDLVHNGASLADEETALTAAKESLNRVRGEFEQLDKKRKDAQEQLQTLNAQMDTLRTTHDDMAERNHRTELALSRIEGEYKQMRDRIWEDYELTFAGAEPFRSAEFKLTEAEKRVGEIRRRIREMGSVNVGAVEEYRQTGERLEESTAQRDDLTKAKLDLQGIVEELERKMELQFAEQFVLINRNFQKTFVTLFGGGKAQLQLTDPKDALNCGIEIVAQPPGKKLQMLSLLSGGERALTAIAILFAILDLKPTPFCILDEIEAALDDANIDTYADYLKSYSENTQFIVITHRKGTMERCDSLYGVVMEEKGVSKTVSVKLNEALA